VLDFDKFREYDFFVLLISFMLNPCVASGEITFQIHEKIQLIPRNEVAGQSCGQGV
jgi:hypothetical protein